MPTLSQYWFQNGFFTGPFDVWNQPYPDGGWAWISGGSCAATLAWNRPDNEEVIDVGPQLNTPATLAQIDSVLSGGANRTSGVMAAGVFWPNVPYYSQNPGAHNNYDMLIRVYLIFISARLGTVLTLMETSLTTFFSIWMVVGTCRAMSMVGVIATMEVDRSARDQLTTH